ncbi:DUF2569 family protein [uncultured Sphingomonas sp.]|uniref:DUF2569 family protein n=1 Tax=uncultured Sphingomonas sp. TaxID=158754 RepID=UPI0035CC91CC
MARYARQGPVGMGGWLAVFVATLALNAVAAVVISWGLFHLAGRASTATFSAFYRTAAVGIILRGGGYGYLAWRLIARRQSGTVRIVVAGLWLLVLTLPIVTLVGAWFGSGTAAVGAVLSPTFFRTAGYAAIWTAYLLRSDRVANTYAPTDNALADVFG